MTDWYYIEGGDRKGPVSEEQVKSLADEGTITAETLVWCTGMGDWVSYASTLRTIPAEVADSPESQDPQIGTCVECNGQHPVSDMLTYEGSTICATCKPIYFQRLQEGAALPGTFAYAGFWIRFVAKVIDGLVLSAINYAMMALFGLVGLSVAGMQADGNVSAMVIMQLVLVALQIGVAAGFTIFFLGKFGATPGKMALKLKVIRSDGSTLTYGRACGRYFAELLSQIVLYIGYIMAGFDEEKRTLHDRICDTRVIKAG